MSYQLFSKEHKVEIFIEKAISWIRENKDQFIIVLATFLFIIALIPIFINYKTKSRKQILDMYALAQNAYYSGNLQEAFQKSGELIAKYPKNRTSKLAYIIKANSLYYMKDYKGSINVYNDFLGKYKKGTLIPLILLSRAYCYEMIGSYQEAINDYSKIINEYADTHILAESYHNKARCSELIGDKQKSIEAYQMVVTLFPRTLWQEMSKSRLEFLTSVNS